MSLAFSKMTLQNKNLIHSYLTAYQPEAGELTFTNLHTWDCSYNVHFTEYEGFLCMVCGFEKGRFALCPIDLFQGKDKINRLAKTIEQLAEYFHSEGLQLVFKRVTAKEEREIQAIEGIVNLSCIGTYDRDNSDYVYNYDEMSTLHGKKYHSKRNHISNLLNTQNPEYVKLTPELLPECTKILTKWHNEREFDPEMITEKIAQQNIIDHFVEYEVLKGALVKIEGRYVGYTIGEMLNNDTVVIHSEKADPFIRGLYPYINQQFLLNEWNGVTFVNREQDCGSPGLRKAKLSYHPAKMTDKYVVNVMKK